MSEDKEKYSGDLYGYEVMLRVLDEETWIVDVRDEVTDEYVDGYEFENYDEAVTEYKLQVNHLCNHKEPKLCNDNWRRIYTYDYDDTILRSTGGNNLYLLDVPWLIQAYLPERNTTTIWTDTTTTAG